jgi:hypothetical protein
MRKGSSMKQYIVDAFTDKPFSGNPAAVCVMDSWPSEESMMKLAMEKLVNEFIRITRSTVVTSRNKPEGHPIPCNMINCFCMFSDYIPVMLDDWIRIDAGRRAKLNRQSN